MKLNLAAHLDKLRAFQVIVESGKMSIAAQRLNVSQPSLTRLIQSLENAAGGTRLLARGRLGVAPTDAGRLLLAYTRSILKDLDDVEQRILNPSEHMAGHIQIGAYASLAEYLWPDFISEFRKKAPKLRLSVRTSETISHHQALEQGAIDVLVDAEPRLSESLISWNLYEDRFNFYVHRRPDHALTPDMAQGLTLIYCPSAFDRNHKTIAQHLEESGYLFREKIELDSFISVLAFARKGLGLSVLPQRLAADTVKGGQLQRVPLKGMPLSGFGAHHFAATVRQERADDPRIRFLVRSLRDWFKATR